MLNKIVSKKDINKFIENIEIILTRYINNVMLLPYNEQTKDTPKEVIDFEASLLRDLAHLYDTPLSLDPLKDLVLKINNKVLPKDLNTIKKTNATEKTKERTIPQVLKKTPPMPAIYGGLIYILGILANKILNNNQKIEDLLLPENIEKLKKLLPEAEIIVKDFLRE